MELGSYGKVWPVGHHALAGFFDEPVLIQEKVDGSQFSFGRLDGELKFRSKNKAIFLGENTAFQPAIDHIISVGAMIHDGYVFRGEFLSKPKHNSLMYARIPMNHIVLFDVTDGSGNQVDVDRWAQNLVVDAIPNFGTHELNSGDDLRVFLEKESFLGGQLVEGVVCKRYNMWDQFGHPAKCKFVSEAFKETHSKEWKKENPNKGDVLDQIVNSYKSPARWQKAIQHAKEDGWYTGTPQDIGPLLKAIQKDVLEECQDEMAQLIFAWAWKTRISRGVTAGFPEWFKNQILDGAFGE